MVTPELESALAKLPDRPGVYLMKGARGEVLYVGKAQSLRNRVRSYGQKATSVGARDADQLEVNASGRTVRLARVRGSGL